MPHTGFSAEFEYQIGVCKDFLEQAKLGGPKYRENYDHSADALGDAMKAREDFVTSFLRRRISIPDEKYLEVQGEMFKTETELHDQLFALKQERSAESIRLEAAAK